MEFALLKHIIGLIFAFLNASSFSLTAHLLKEQRRDSGSWLCRWELAVESGRCKCRGQRWPGGWGVVRLLLF